VLTKQAVAATLVKLARPVHRDMRWTASMGIVVCLCLCVPHAHSRGAWTQAVLERLAVDMDAEVRKISHSHVLVVHGTKDTVIPYSDGEAFHSAISGSELVLVEGADHGYSQPHHAEQMMRAVEEFVLKHRGSGTTVLHS
jgi:fermentation-respiration switch protein FrsA (DUF1100 family)